MAPSLASEWVKDASLAPNVFKTEITEMLNLCKLICLDITLTTRESNHKAQDNYSQKNVRVIELGFNDNSTELNRGEKAENSGGDKEIQRDDSGSKSTSDSTGKLSPVASTAGEDAERRVVEKIASFNEPCFGNDYGGEPNTDNESGSRILWVMVSRRFHKTVMGIKLLDMKIVMKVREKKLNSTRAEIDNMGHDGKGKRWEWSE
ncbi:hypothetical protein V6N11_068604 [Hibiscus sabdariffa]|uniref:Uncharacterized protein n=1 Tax=Hibiscus sabdariffa TaxID=183260 RepID=A0ABR2PA65_9ROSI